MNGIKLIQERKYRRDANSCEQQFKEVEDIWGIDKMVLSINLWLFPLWLRGQ